MHTHTPTPRSSVPHAAHSHDLIRVHGARENDLKDGGTHRALRQRPARVWVARGRGRAAPSRGLVRAGSCCCRRAVRRRRLWPSRRTDLRRHAAARARRPHLHLPRDRALVPVEERGDHPRRTGRRHRRWRRHNSARLNGRTSRRGCPGTRCGAGLKDRAQGGEAGGAAQVAFTGSLPSAPRALSSPSPHPAPHHLRGRSRTPDNSAQPTHRHGDENVPRSGHRHPSKTPEAGRTGTWGRRGRMVLGGV